MMKAKFIFLGWVVVAGLISAQRASGAEVQFRRDIDPALLYFQAMQSMPQLSEEETKQLFEHRFAWRAEPFDELTLGLLGKYDNAFKLLHRARFSGVKCEWGYDLTDGPEVLLTGLALAKRLRQVARLRAMVALDKRDFVSARDDLLGAFWLGRNLSTDRVLISSLVQIALENIVMSVVTEVAGTGEIVTKKESANEGRRFYRVMEMP